MLFFLESASRLLDEGQGSGKQDGRGRRKALGFRGFGRKIGYFTYGMVNTQGDSATDGGIRSHTAWMPSVPTRPVFDYPSHSVSEIRFGDSPETQCLPPPPAILFSAALPLI